ncbi:MAG TPA: ATP-binding protein [Bryobacteraceae bacterium]
MLCWVGAWIAVAAPKLQLRFLAILAQGKSFLACALAQKACRDGYSALYTRAQSLFRDLGMARADGSLRGLLARSGRIDVQVIGDWQWPLCPSPSAATSGRSAKTATSCAPRF